MDIEVSQQDLPFNDVCHKKYRRIHHTLPLMLHCGVLGSFHDRAYSKVITSIHRPGSNLYEHGMRTLASEIGVFLFILAEMLSRENIRILAPNARQTLYGY